MAMQVHAGYGDRDMDLPHCNPWLLRALLERSEAARSVPIVLLHGSFPYTGEAAVLAAIYPNVYFDVATCVPPFTEAIQLDVWRTALAMVPLTRIHASTDAAGLAEQISLGIALAELVEADVLDAGEAEQASADILAGTARRIYFGREPGRS
jgi:predicted TIM-barrel fold metal-dependent hydrolase